MALILAALAVCVPLASMWPHLAGGQATLPAEVAEGAVLQQDCDDDVSVTISSEWGVIERTTYTLKDPPDYKAGDDIGIYYDVTNSSCRSVTVTVELKGSVSEATIHNADATDDMACLEGCTINAGSTINGNAGWDLSKHPNARGEKVVATVTVTAPADFADVNTDNNSATSTQAINIVNEEPDPAPDIAVKSITASKTTAVVGETVNFTVKVENVGDADADADTTVTLDLGEDTAELDSATVSVLADGPEKTVTLSWDTHGAAAGEHNLRSLAQTEGDGNADNDSKTVTVTLLEPSVDVAVKSVTASATEAVVGETVDFTVTLENYGNVPAPWPQVSLFDANAAEDAQPLASKEAENSIDVDGMETVTISWDTDEAEAGAYGLRVLAEVADDNDATNDSATASLTLHNPVDVALSFTETPDATAIAGNSVSVPFTIANSANHDTGEVTVSLYVTQEGEERGDAEPADTKTVSTITVGGSATGSFDWDTTGVAVGDYDLELVAATFGDTDASNNTVSTSIEIRNWLVLKNVTPETSEAVTGDTISFTAQVENVGTGELTDVTVGFNESQASTPLGSAAIASIAAGSTASATVEWDTAGRDVGQVELFVIAAAGGQDPDRDDAQSVNVTIRNPIALSSAVPASTDNVAGLPVTINVQVRNESIAEVAGVEVKLDGVDGCDNKEDEEEEKGCATIAAIPPGETGAVVLEWDTAGVEVGNHKLKIAASLAGYGNDANDESSMTVALREPVVDVGLTGATINRNVAAVAQTLEIVATVANRSEAPAAAAVTLYTVQNLNETTVVARETSPLIEPGSSGNVELRWETTGKPSGVYDLRVSVDAPGDTTLNDNTGALTVELFRSAFEGDDAPKTCLEDVGINVDSVRHIGEPQRASSDYQVGENLRVVYTVYNYSCGTDVAAAIAMTGPNDQPVNDAKARCFSDCTVPFGGKAEGEVAWIIPALPALSDQPITATVTVVSPEDFTDTNEANNSAESTDRINIVHPDDIRLDLGEENGNKVSARRPLTGPEFGAVDVRLVSAVPTQTNLPFAAETVEVAVAVAHDGPAAEPAAVRFVLASDDGTDSLELRRQTMVIQNGQTRTGTVAVPLRDVLPGDHTIRVLLSAAVDRSPENNAASLDITRMAPLVNVEMADVAVSPDMLILGDDATVSLEVRNASEIALPLSLELYVDDDAEPIGAKTIDQLAPGGQSEELIAWRVPTSARMLGKHTLRLMASSKEFGAVANTDKDVTFHIDAEILRINALPTETAMHGQEVAIEVEVQNNGPATVNVPVTLRFPSATKNPETRSPSVPAEDTKTARFTWKTRDYTVGDHMLTAAVPDQHNIATGEKSLKLPFRVSPQAVTATIVDVSVLPTAPMVGESVSIAVTVRNDGPVATRIPVTLHFPLGGRQPETKHPHVAPGRTGTATFEWLTSRYPVGTHQFHIDMAAINAPQLRFTIDLLPTVENVMIVGMGTYPAGTAMVGEPVEVWIDVRNDGPLAIRVPVRLTFPSGDKKPEQDSERIEPGEITRYSFTWRTSKYEPGIHTLQAAIPLRYNATLGRTTDEIRFTLTPLIINATIVEVAVNPQEPRVGEPVTITVIVQNDGRIAANIPATLHFPSNEKQPETRRPHIGPGANGEVSFTWRTSGYQPGTQAFVVELASTPPLRREFTVELLPPIIDVAIVGIGSDPSESAVQGQEVKIWVDVVNNGPSALNVPVQLAFPSGDKQPERKSPRIEPGQTARVEFTWKTSNYDPGNHLLTAVLLAEHNVVELDTSATIQIRLVPARLIASIVDASWEPESPVVGEPVAITVKVRNDGLVTSSIPITLHFPSGDKQPETKQPLVAPKQTGTATFEWLTSRYEPGAHAFVVEVASPSPSTHKFTIELLPPIIDVAIVGIGSDPSESAVQGQEVKIWVDVVNNGPSALNVPVQLAFPSGDKQPERKSPRIEPGQTARVEFTWKTANYEAGVHTFTATLLAEHNVTELDTSATIQIRLISRLLIASIVDVVWSPNSPVVGEPVDITVTVRNDGPVATKIPITLNFPSGDRQPETRRPHVAPGGVGSADFTWRTSRYEPGDHVFRLQIPGVAGAIKTFEIELRPPEVDFAVVDFQTPDPLHPILKGDWVEITVIVQNRGPYAGRGTVHLLNAANLDTMYEQSASLEPGEFREVGFTWKTLRYPVGGYELLVRVDAEHDTDPDNDESVHARVDLLTNRDITVGFGNIARPAVLAEPTSEADLSSIPRYRHDIVVVGNSKTPLGRPAATTPNPPIGVSPKPTSGNHDPARLYWRWRSAQVSPWECARFQRTVGENLPRAVICPRAPALVR